MSLKVPDQKKFYESKGEKKWWMKGEVVASDTINKDTNQGPLEDDFEITHKSVGVRKSSSQSRDDIIKRVLEAIKNKTYDDPVRKVKPTNIKKKEIEISGEKSKLSLADEYLNAFKKETDSVKLKGDANDSWKLKLRELFDTLNPLFHMSACHIKPATEAKILLAPSASGIEEISVSGPRILVEEAPQDILKESKISEMKGTTERSKLDRKRKKQIIGKQIAKKKKIGE